MGRSLRKHGHLVLVKVVDTNGLDTVLGYEHGSQSSFDDNVDFGAARMDMRCIESAGADEADGHGDTCSNQSGEGFAIGFDRSSTSTGGGGFIWRRVEVVDEIALTEQADAVDCSWGKQELLNEVDVVGSRVVYESPLGVSFFYPDFRRD